MKYFFPNIKLNYFFHYICKIGCIVSVLIYFSLFNGYSTNIYSLSVQDGYGYSNINISKKILGNFLKIDNFSNFPDGLSKKSISKFSGAVFDGTYIWMIPCNANYIMQIDPLNNTFSKIDNWPDGFDSLSKYKFKSGVYDGNNNLWLIPFNSDSVIKLDLSTKNMTIYNSWPSEINPYETAKFIGGVYYNGFIYMIPASSKSVVSINVNTGEMNSYNNFPENFLVDSVKFCGGNLDSLGNLWMIPANANQIVKMKLSTGEMTGYENFPQNINPYSGEKFAGGVLDNSNNLWLIPNNAPCIIKFDLLTNTMKSYDNFPSNVFNDTQNKFHGGTFDGKNIYLAPHNAKSIVKIDTLTGDLSSISDFANSDIFFSGKFEGAVFDGDNLWFVPYNSTDIVKISNDKKPSVNINLSIEPYERTFVPNISNIVVHHDNIEKIEYFILKTSDKTEISKENFYTYYNSSKNLYQESINKNVIPAKVNGIYWIMILFSNGDSYLKNLIVDNIYTPCLAVKGIENNNTLYETPINTPHGLPLEMDNSLVESPSLGYISIDILANEVENYHIDDSSKKHILLNDLKYISNPSNTIIFNYCKTFLPEIDYDKDSDEESKSLDDQDNSKSLEETNNLEDTNNLNNSTTLILDNNSNNKIDNSNNYNVVNEDKNNNSNMNSFELYNENKKFQMDFVKNKSNNHNNQILGLLKNNNNSVIYNIEPSENTNDEPKEKLVTYTLGNISYNRETAVTHYKISSNPSNSLKFVKGIIPSFFSSDEITYNILCKNSSSDNIQILYKNIDANKPFTFINPTDDVLTEIYLEFEKISQEFIQNGSIEYSFLVLDNSYDHFYEVSWESAVNYNNNIRNLKSKITNLENLISISQKNNAYLINLLEKSKIMLEDPNISELELSTMINDIDKALNDTDNGFNLAILVPITGVLVSLFSIFAIYRKKLVT